MKPDGDDDDDDDDIMVRMRMVMVMMMTYSFPDGRTDTDRRRDGRLQEQEKWPSLMPSAAPNRRFSKILEGSRRSSEAISCHVVWSEQAVVNEVGGGRGKGGGVVRDDDVDSKQSRRRRLKCMASKTV